MTTPTTKPSWTSRLRRWVNGLHGLVKIQATVGTAITALIAVATPLTHVAGVPYVATIAAGTVTVLSTIAGMLGLKAAARKAKPRS